MPFYLYRKFHENSEECFELERSVHLAGRNILYNLWLKQGKPANKGWHAGLEDIVCEATNGAGNLNTHTVLIDLNPSVKGEITILELLDVWAYTYADDSRIIWTPLMLKLRDVYYQKTKPLTPQERQNIIQKFCRPNYGPDIFEFLYLQGDNRGWNWGKVGQVNAALIYEDARAFFKKHF
jgi:hypothetical protein